MKVIRELRFLIAWPVLFTLIEILACRVSIHPTHISNFILLFASPSNGVDMKQRYKHHPRNPPLLLPGLWYREQAVL